MKGLMPSSSRLVSVGIGLKRWGGSGLGNLELWGMGILELWGMGIGRVKMGDRLVVKTIKAFTDI